LNQWRSLGGSIDSVVLQQGNGINAGLYTANHTNVPSNFGSYLHQIFTEKGGGAKSQSSLAMDILGRKMHFVATKHGSVLE